MKHTDTSGAWRPTAELSIVRRRAELLACIRTFFLDRAVLEVDTPLLSHAANPDVYIESFCSHISSPQGQQTLYLQTSPEFAMKRMLAAGSGPIYQICKAFRLEEQGRLHNPEFTMLEWYRPGFDHHLLMQEVEDLLKSIGMHTDNDPIPRLSYQSLFEQYIGVNPHIVSRAGLLECVAQHEIPIVAAHLNSLSHDDLLSILLTHIIEPAIGEKRLLFVYDYPASQASMARLSEGPEPLAERFELYAYGVELANGFHELTDVTEQTQRFELDLAVREKRGLSKVALDEHFLEALRAGLPDSAGVALGLDRLVMIMTESKSLQEVISFPFNKA